MKKARKFAKRSGREDMKPFPVIFRNALAAILNGTYRPIASRFSMATAHLRRQIHTHTQFGPWDLLIAHPPCTDLAVSGARWFPEKQRDFRQQKACVFFMQMILANCERIAVENPVSIMSTVYRKPDQIIQPWQFGHGETKATCLWLKGLPPLCPTQIVSERNQRVWRMPPSKERAKLRSRTYTGIARAMAEQWG